MSIDWPSIAVTIPTWNRKDLFAKSIKSIVDQDYPGLIEILCPIDDSPTEPDTDWAYFASVVSTLSSDKRVLKVKRGPGMSNWRPGAIHFPVLEHWLMTKCDLVTYQFSDEYSGPSRFFTQVKAMREAGVNWSYLKSVQFIDRNGANHDVRNYQFLDQRIGTNQLMTPTLLINRRVFEECGGLDFPMHVGAMAEIWIQTFSRATGPGLLVEGPPMYYFMDHADSLGNDQKPGSTTYKNNTLVTGWLEEDHWRLWSRVAGKLTEKVAEISGNRRNRKQ